MTMKDQDIRRIESVIEGSVNWESNNADSVDFHRLEGTLSNSDFKKALIQDAHTYAPTLGSIVHKFVCGFEIEFFLEPEKVALLELEMANMLPDYQMLLVCLDSVPKTNHRNFYLIQEVTGQPPEGKQSYEIVSPKLDAKSLPFFITKIVGILGRLGASDNDTVGYHFHVSTVDNIQISPISLIYFLHDRGLLNEPERQYTRDIVSQIFSFSPDHWQWLFEEVTRKCYNVNFLYFTQHNHIELRSIGGTGYLAEPDRIIQSSLHCLLAYEDSITTPFDKVAEAIKQTYPMSQKALKTIDLDYQNLKKSPENEVWFVSP